MNIYLDDLRCAPLGYSLFTTAEELIEFLQTAATQDIEIDRINMFLNNHKQIQEVHHLHIWALSSTENALTVHIIPKENVKLEDTLTIKKDIKEGLAHQNIQHITIEFEKKSDDCQDKDC